VNGLNSWDHWHLRRDLHQTRFDMTDSRLHYHFHTACRPDRRHLDIDIMYDEGMIVLYEYVTCFQEWTLKFCIMNNYQLERYIIFMLCSEISDLFISLSRLWENVWRSRCMTDFMIVIDRHFHCFKKDVLKLIF